LSIQEIYNKLLGGEEIEFSVVDSDNRSPTKTLCQLSIDGLSISALLKSESPMPYGYNSIEIILNLTLPDGLIIIIVEANKVAAFEITGIVREIDFHSDDGLVSSILYDMAGAGGSPFIRNDYSWTSEHQFESDKIIISYKFVGNKIKADLSKPILKKSVFYTQINQVIEDEVSVVSLAFSFCRSTKVEWVMKRVLHEDKIICSRFLDSDAPESFLNRVNPMQVENKLWIDFINHVLKEKLQKKDLIEDGIFQAISNLCWSGIIDEWSLIQHAAALEGLCKHQTIDVIDEKKYKKIRNAGIKSLKSSGMELNIEPSKIDQIVENIHDNKRSLNGYPIKWCIENTLKDYGLNSFCNKHISEIYEAIKMRNTVVHTGWSHT